jgi:type I restriction enzyme R subunit
MTRPEDRARENIDKLLKSAGWVIQDYAELNLRAARGVAVREFPLKTGFADYLLFVDRKAIGAVEAKAEGIPLSGVEAQSAKYSAGLPDLPPAWRKPLPFLYESTGVESFFTNGLDPEPRSRRIFSFHRPETLAEWITDPATLRSRLRHLPPLNTTGLWDAQSEAIRNLECSLANDRPRALIQMATGSGKTFTAVSFIYRLIKFADARRVLFLVDRGNLGRQTLKEFQQYVTPDDGRKFTELYNVQHLQSNVLDPVSRVCITTIQRLYSILSGESEFEPELEERSLFEMEDALPREEKKVRYNPKVPIEYFDFIVTDECHRSIYSGGRSWNISMHT